MHAPLQHEDFATEAPASASLAESLDLVKRFLRRRWKLIALTTLPGIALAAAAIAIVPAKYKAAATILLDKQRLNFFQQQSVVSDLAIESYAAIEGQLEILKSDTIARSVIKKLHLENDQDFSLPQPGSGLLSKLGFVKPTPLTEAMRERLLLDTFAKLRAITRLGPSFAIEISFQSHSAERAAQVANALVEAYITDLLVSRQTAARDASDWLRERLRGLRAQVAESENAVVKFREKNEIVDAGGKPIVGQQIAEISSQLTTARSQLSDASARMDRAQAAAREFASSTVNPSATDTPNNPLMNKMQEQYFEFSSREAEFSARFGPDHEAAVKLRQRMDDLKAGMWHEMQRMSQSFASEKAILEKHVMDLEASLQRAIAKAHNTEQAQVKLRELESIAQSYRTLYDGLLRRHSEAVLQEEQPITNARIISPASEPLSKSLKRPLIFAAALSVGSLGLGLALSLLFELRDRTFRSRGDIENKLKSDFIGMIPNWKAVAAPASSGKALVSVEDASDQCVWRSNSPLWAYILSPVSDFAEAIGHVTFAILRHAGKNDGRIIGFTSVLPNEGASTVAAAVVQSLAISGRRVILVDCDLRHPELTRDLAPHAKIGLQEILFGQAVLDDAILMDPKSGFAFLPGVVDGLAARPEELLEAGALVSIFSEMRRRYDYVIVDLPPMFPMLDVSMTDRLIDSFVIVVEWGASKIDTVSHALTRSPGVYNRMLGLVLNKVDMSRLRLYDSSAEYYDARRYANYLLKGPLTDRAAARTKSAVR